MDNLHNVVVFHNPGAGDAAHEKDELIALLKGAGYKAQYYSTKKDWKDADVKNADLIVVGGGDGTVRKIAGWLLENDLLKLKIPVTILPLGTANNLSKTLSISGETKQLIAQWKNWSAQPYDIGHVTTNAAELKGKTTFDDDPEKKIAADLERLRLTLRDTRPSKTTVTIDGETIVDDFLLVEVMNSRHLGTNLDFNPVQHSGDGKFQVVMVNSSEKNFLDEFILEHINHSSKHIRFTTVHGNEISISSQSHLYHLDDQLYNVEGEAPLHVKAYMDQIHFLSPVGKNTNTRG
ncbi:MAG: hypothetical protein EOO02_09930 [Chitinophagaceae bacterium]|nr:MAG: hypothetical protein EOO02_09930 [Chitinophagaceae bacterium]